MLNASVCDRIAKHTEPDLFGGCWLWAKMIRKDGYGAMKRAGKYVLAHRASYEAHRGPAGHLWVLHKCDVRACVNPDHLFLGTPSDNVRDMVQKGRAVHAASVTRLTASEVDEMIRLRREGLAFRVIAKRLGRSAQAVGRRLVKLGVSAPEIQRPDLQKLVLRSVEFDTNGGCWLWSRYVAKDGYGHACFSQRGTLVAHRFAYEVFVGPIPSGLSVKQSCGVRSCCNPAHLFTTYVQRPNAGLAPTKET